ncbi:hypothetical protein BC938DRAFT_475225 [Jimgerdemannia flammicorona]|uniref:Uncharacterized protein n=1 Tax=Jimgerdemannia flammicorona TaxID=994334 RepID=A0A433PYS4_9FUNG|nr:hypothetical protein BC938DRAFT_475225 [Jimgerdemannia flammicorona]
MNAESIEHYPGYSDPHRYLLQLFTWSYSEFLKLHRDVIVSSPPFSDEWNGLDGTWARRFLTKAKDLNPLTFAAKKKKGAPDQSAFWSGVSVCILAQVMVVGTLSQYASDLRASVCILGPTIATCIFLLDITYRLMPVISERSSNGLKRYWEEVIYDQKKLAVKYTHIIGSLDLLDKAGKHNTKDLLSKDSSNPFLVSTTIAKNSVEEDAGGEEKMSDQDYEEEDEYTDAQYNIDDLKSKGMLNTRKHALDGVKTCQLRKKITTMDSTEDLDEGENVPAIVLGDTDGDKIVDAVCIKTNGKVIDGWMLPDGRNVGELFTKYRATVKERDIFAASHIFDLADVALVHHIRSLSDDDELWSEIEDAWDAKWGDYRPSEHVREGEKASRAVSYRKNSQRQLGETKIAASKLDAAVVTRDTWRVELMTMEAGRQDTIEGQSKWLSDRYKLARGLKDQIDFIYKWLPGSQKHRITEVEKDLYTPWTCHAPVYTGSASCFDLNCPANLTVMNCSSRRWRDFLPSRTNQRIAARLRAVLEILQDINRTSTIETLQESDLFWSPRKNLRTQPTRLTPPSPTPLSSKKRAAVVGNRTEKQGQKSKQV